jgi:hypothetical protein
MSADSPSRDEYEVRVKVFELRDEDSVDQRTKDLDILWCADHNLVGSLVGLGGFVVQHRERTEGVDPLGVNCTVLSMHGDDFDGLPKKRMEGTSVQEYQDLSLGTSWEG